MEKINFKNHFFIFQNITALSYFCPGGGGGGIGHSGDKSCAAHLLIDLRSPNLVTFPDVVLLTLAPLGGGAQRAPPCGFSQIAPEVLGVSL